MAVAPTPIPVPLTERASEFDPVTGRDRIVALVYLVFAVLVALLFGAGAVGIALAL